MAEKAGLDGYVDFMVGDAVSMIGELAAGFDFVLVDLWKELYVPCLEAVYPKLNPGAITYLTRTGTYSIDKARRELGYEPKVDLAEGMRRTEAWLREEGLLG